MSHRRQNPTKTITEDGKDKFCWDVGYLKINIFWNVNLYLEVDDPRLAAERTAFEFLPTYDLLYDNIFSKAI